MSAFIFISCMQIIIKDLRPFFFFFLLSLVKILCSNGHQNASCVASTFISVLFQGILYIQMGEDDENPPTVVPRIFVFELKRYNLSTANDPKILCAMFLYIFLSYFFFRLIFQMRSFHRRTCNLFKIMSILL